MSSLTEHDISDEIYREYDFGSHEAPRRVYRIAHPKKLFLRDGGTTHRVLDSEGIIHCVPAPGNFGCVLRWLSPKGASF